MIISASIASSDLNNAGFLCWVARSNISFIRPLHRVYLWLCVGLCVLSEQNMASQQGITPNKDLALLVPSQSAGATRPTMSQKHNIKNLKVCAQCTNNKAVSNWSPLERLSTLAGQVAGSCFAAGAALVLRLKEARRRWAPLAALGATKRTKAQVAVVPPQLSAVALLFGCFFV